MAFSDYPLHILKNPRAITASSTGLQIAPTLDGLGLTSADEFATSPVGPWLEHKTTTELNASCGMITTYDLTAAAWTPKAEFVVRMPPLAQLTLVRFWVGWFEARPDLLTATSTGTRLAAFNYEETGLGVGSWSAVVSNGVQPPTSTSIGTGVQGNLTYRMTVEIQGGDVAFNLVTGLTTHTETIPVTPGSTQYLGLGVRATATSTASRSISWRRASWRPYPI